MDVYPGSDKVRGLLYARFNSRMLESSGDRKHPVCNSTGFDNFCATAYQLTHKTKYLNVLFVSSNVTNDPMLTEWFSRTIIAGSWLTVDCQWHRCSRAEPTNIN